LQKLDQLKSEKSVKMTKIGSKFSKSQIFSLSEVTESFFFELKSKKNEKTEQQPTLN